VKTFKDNTCSSSLFVINYDNNKDQYFIRTCDWDEKVHHKTIPLLYYKLNNNLDVNSSCSFIIGDIFIRALYNKETE